MNLESTLQAIQPPDCTLLSQAQSRLDCLTKPVGSLGRLEELAAQYVAIRGDLAPTIPEAMVMTHGKEEPASHAEMKAGRMSAVSATSAWAVQLRNLVTSGSLA